YSKAKQHFKKALNVDKKFVEAYLQLAKIQQKKSDYKGAIKLLRRAHRYLPEGKDYASLHYELAFLYYRSGAYPQAHKALRHLALSNLSPTLHPQVKRLQKDVAFALEQIKSTVTLFPKKLPPPLNQFASQYFPVLTVDQKTLFFTACVKDNDRENIYVSHQDEAGNWSTPQPLQGTVTTQHHEGTCAISADGKMLVFTACARADNYGTCDLYVTYRQGDAWTRPKNLGAHINSPGWESQPSLSADGKTLYFVSERAGNHGKRDIWKSILQEDGEWATPTNLGPPINLDGCELSPFIHPNGCTLFFASDRCPSLGGFDIYYSNWVDGAWTTPVNLGYPINKHKDQASLFITADGKKGYYADGNQGDLAYRGSHLYEFDFPPGLVQFPISDFIKLHITDAKTGQPIDAQVVAYDLATKQPVATRQATADTGEVTLVLNKGAAYGIFVKREGYLFDSIHVDYTLRGQSAALNFKKVCLKPIRVAQSQILKNIFFRFGEHQIDTRSTTELDRLVEFLQTHVALHIEIEGHTDHIGTAAYNQQLSIARARAVYDYLVAAGIDKGRLSYQGYGKRHPISLEDTAAGQQLNRRVAFRIVQT
ncbi:MAG: OmpA family protein, partial [Bacteroidota bacterium]